MDIPAPTKARTRLSAAHLFAVVIGGFLGAALRVGLGLVFPEAHGFPATTLLVNITGTAALATLSSYWEITRRGPGWLRAGVGTGFLGAYTTFSSLILFMLGTTLPISVGVMALSLVLCGAAAWISMAAVVRLLARRGFPHPTSGPALPPSLDVDPREHS